MKRETTEVTFMESFDTFEDAAEFVRKKTSQLLGYEVVELRLNSVGGPYRVGLTFMKEVYEGVPKFEDTTGQEELFGRESTLPKAA